MRFAFILLLLDQVARHPRPATSGRTQVAPASICTVGALIATIIFLAFIPARASATTITIGWQTLAPVRTPPVLYQPSGIAVNSRGFLYVTDADPGAVQKLSSSGVPLQRWTSGNLGPLHTPSGIAVTRSGNLAVADAGNRRVVIFTPNGTALRSWPVSIQANQTPFAIGAGPGGTIFTLAAAGPTTLTLRRFNSVGRLLGSVRVAIHVPINAGFPGGPPVDRTIQPLGIAVSKTGTIFLTFQQSVCSEDRNEYCRVYEILQRRSAKDWWSGEWTVTQVSGAGVVPTGLALNRRGNIVVPSPRADAIYLYSPSGKRLAHWQPAAPGVGDFTDLGGIAAGRNGNVFVVGERDQTVQKLSPNGTRVALWGVGRSDLFSFPHGLAVDGAGNLYVADTNDNLVKKLAPTGLTAASWPDPDGPVGVAVGRDGNVYVTDARSGVRVFSPDGKEMRRWGSTGKAPGQFQNPGGIVVSAGGEVYVADTGNSRVQRFSRAGTLIGTWGSLGADAGRLSSPQGIAIGPSGNVYVADSGNSRIETFSPTGAYLAAYPVPVAPWEGPYFADFPNAVAVDAAGNIFTAYNYDAVIEIVPGSTPRFWGGWGLAPGEFKSVQALAFDSHGALYAIDVDPVYNRSDRIQVLAQP